MKVDCIIKNWQIHNIIIPKKHIKQFKLRFPSAIFKPGPLIFTGTVIKDNLRRWSKGDHMRSTYIVSIDRKMESLKHKILYIKCRMKVMVFSMILVMMF